MNQVQVFEPWYVAALDSIRRFLPRSRTARVFAGAAAVFVAATLSVATLWVSSRLDAVFFFASVGTERMRSTALTLAGNAVSSALGEGFVAMLRGNGSAGIAIAISGLVFTILVAAFSLRAVTAAARRRRS
jgi:hypothetical protein